MVPVRPLLPSTKIRLLRTNNVVLKITRGMKLHGFIPRCFLRCDFVAAIFFRSDYDSTATSQPTFSLVFGIHEGIKGRAGRLLSLERTCAREVGESFAGACRVFAACRLRRRVVRYLRRVETSQ